MDDGMKRNNKEGSGRTEIRVCPHCGARVLSEVCQYCGSYIGEVSTADLAAEYPVLECREATITFWNLAFPAVFAFMFGFFGFAFPFLFSGTGEEKTVMLISTPFAVISLCAFAIILWTLYKYFIVSVKGTEIEGTVYGYMDDTIAYNGVNGQVAKILIDTPKGRRFILYQLGSTMMKYPINGRVRIKMYRRYFRVLPEELV